MHYWTSVLEGNCSRLHAAPVERGIVVTCRGTADWCRAEAGGGAL